jgi:tetrahydromethanopterin S-methyltransferase subunit E
MIPFLYNIGYSPVFGEPLALWLGLIAMLLFISAATVMALALHTKIKFPFKVHIGLAVTGLIVALIHMALAISAYI